MLFSYPNPSLMGYNEKEICPSLTKDTCAKILNEYDYLPLRYKGFYPGRCILKRYFFIRKLPCVSAVIVIRLIKIETWNQNQILPCYFLIDQIFSFFYNVTNLSAMGLQRLYSQNVHNWPKTCLGFLNVSTYRGNASVTREIYLPRTTQNYEIWFNYI